MRYLRVTGIMADYLQYFNYDNINFVYGCLYIILGLIVFFGIRRVRKMLIQKVSGTETKWDDILLASVGKPVTIIAFLIPTYYGIVHYLLTPEGVEKFMKTELNEVVIVLVSAWFLSALVQNIMEFYGRKIIQSSKNDITSRILGLLDLLAEYIIWFVAILVILEIYKVNITPLLAGAGVLGIAVALAAQDMLGNFFGGAMIYADRPFKVGDRVKIGEFVGDVLDIGSRSTRIRTLDYELMTIPNSTISTSIITNYAMPDIKLKVRLPFSVGYGSDIDKVKEILMEVATQAARNFDYILEVPTPEVFFLTFGESSLDLMVTFWTNRFDRKWESRDYINSTVLRRFREEGIEIPCRQRDLRVLLEDSAFCQKNPAALKSQKSENSVTDTCATPENTKKRYYAGMQRKHEIQNPNKVSRIVGPYGKIEYEDDISSG
ncbi:mechanosensitive ion channel family protein [Methanolapillus ohkumae]|uniref:Mechanosensitive ion channel family protein n=1 Tax=Methanolapillus ohkumae TaxID=3028298 RepID=A0AA96V5X6_9EURY|nr:hypothetical protein MsAm2_02320 [Methanosarcinaceae archaeon Am2]